MTKKVNYAKIFYDSLRHEERYIRRAEADNLVCQECSGSGEVLDDVIDGYYLYGRCGWCLGCGKVTRWVRGQWLYYKKVEKAGKRGL